MELFYIIFVKTKNNIFVIKTNKQKLKIMKKVNYLSAWPGFYMMVFDAPLTPVQNKGKVVMCSDYSELFKTYDKLVGDHISIESDVRKMRHGDIIDFSDHGKYVIIQILG